MAQQGILVPPEPGAAQDALPVGVRKELTALLRGGSYYNATLLTNDGTIMCATSLLKYALRGLGPEELGQQPLAVVAQAERMLAQLAARGAPIRLLFVAAQDRALPVLTAPHALADDDSQVEVQAQALLLDVLRAHALLNLTKVHCAVDDHTYSVDARGKLIPTPLCVPLMVQHAARTATGDPFSIYLTLHKPSSIMMDVNLRAVRHGDRDGMLENALRGVEANHILSRLRLPVIIMRGHTPGNRIEWKNNAALAEVYWPFADKVDGRDAAAAAAAAEAGDTIAIQRSLALAADLQGVPPALRNASWIPAPQPTPTDARVEAALSTVLDALSGSGSGALLSDGGLGLVVALAAAHAAATAAAAAATPQPTTAAALSAALESYVVHAALLPRLPLQHRVYNDICLAAVGAEWEEVQPLATHIYGPLRLVLRTAMAAMCDANVKPTAANPLGTALCGLSTGGVCDTHDTRLWRMTHGLLQHAAALAAAQQQQATKPGPAATTVTLEQVRATVFGADARGQETAAAVTAVLTCLRAANPHMSFMLLGHTPPPTARQEDQAWLAAYATQREHMKRAAAAAVKMPALPRLGGEEGSGGRARAGGGAGAADVDSSNFGRAVLQDAATMFDGVPKAEVPVEQVAAEGLSVFSDTFHTHSMRRLTAIRRRQQAYTAIVARAPLQDAMTSSDKVAQLGVSTNIKPVSTGVVLDAWMLKNEQRKIAREAARRQRITQGLAADPILQKPWPITVGPAAAVAEAPGIKALIAQCEQTFKSVAEDAASAGRRRAAIVAQARAKHRNGKEQEALEEYLRYGSDDIGEDCQWKLPDEHDKRCLMPYPAPDDSVLAAIGKSRKEDRPGQLQKLQGKALADAQAAWRAWRTADRELAIEVMALRHTMWARHHGAPRAGAGAAAAESAAAAVEEVAPTLNDDETVQLYYAAESFLRRYCPGFYASLQSSADTAPAVADAASLGAAVAALLAPASAATASKASAATAPAPPTPASKADAASGKAGKASGKAAKGGAGASAGGGAGAAEPPAPPTQQEDILQDLQRKWDDTVAKQLQCVISVLVAVPPSRIIASRLSLALVQAAAASGGTAAAATRWSKHIQPLWQDATASPGSPAEQYVRWQLQAIPKYLLRPQGQADKRVRRFKPDLWQRELLNIIDADESALVSVPTSAGKTMISYYAMEHVLRADDDGVVVYVAPTKALCDQVVSEVYARFDKAYRTPSRKLVGLFVADKRYDELESQILVCVPQTLEILLLSAVNNSWARRVKRIIFDEVHSVLLEDSSVWERLLLFAACPILALSATLGDLPRFHGWLDRVEARRRKDKRLHVIPNSTTIQHISRWNDLATYVFQPAAPGETALVPMHPVAALHPSVFGEGKPLPQLHLLPEQSLALHDTLHHVVTTRTDADAATREAATALLQRVSLRSFFPAAARVSMFQAHTWGAALLGALAQLAQLWPAAAEAVINALKRPVAAALDASDAGMLVARQKASLLANVCRLYDALREAEMLPSIVFCLNKDSCNMMAATLAERVIEAEEEYRASPAFRAQLAAKAKEEDDLQAAVEAKRAGMSNTAKGDTDAAKQQAAEVAEMGKRLEELAQSRRDLANGLTPALPKFTLNARAPSLDEVDAMVAKWHFSAREVVTAEMEKYRGYQLERRKAKDEGDIAAATAAHWKALRSLKWSLLLRGIAIHHSELDVDRRNATEYFFRMRQLSVVFATSTLAQGIDMPCRTVVLAGDSAYLNAINSRQMMGRAGRRGKDLRGNVVFYVMPSARVSHLLSAALPSLSPSVPVTPSQTLRYLVRYESIKAQLDGGGEEDEEEEQQQEGSAPAAHGGAGAGAIVTAPVARPAAEASSWEDWDDADIVAIGAGKATTAAVTAPALAPAPVAAARKAPHPPADAMTVKEAKDVLSGLQRLFSLNSAQSLEQLPPGLQATYVRFMLSTLRHHGLLNEHERPLAMSALPVHLHYHEPANFMLIALLKQDLVAQLLVDLSSSEPLPTWATEMVGPAPERGCYKRKIDQGCSEDTMRRDFGLLFLFSFLFHRDRPSALGGGGAEESLSFIRPTSLPRYILHCLSAFNRYTVTSFTDHLKAYKLLAAEDGGIATLPFSRVPRTGSAAATGTTGTTGTTAAASGAAATAAGGAAAAGGAGGGGLVEHLSGLSHASILRSPFAAMKGHMCGDKFFTISHITDHMRLDVPVDTSLLPTLELSLPVSRWTVDVYAQADWRNVRNGFDVDDAKQFEELNQFSRALKAIAMALTHRWWVLFTMTMQDAERDKPWPRVDDKARGLWKDPQNFDADVLGVIDHMAARLADVSNAERRAEVQADLDLLLSELPVLIAIRGLAVRYAMVKQQLHSHTKRYGNADTARQAFVLRQLEHFAFRDVAGSPFAQLKARLQSSEGARAGAGATAAHSAQASALAHQAAAAVEREEAADADDEAADADALAADALVEQELAGLQELVAEATAVPPDLLDGVGDDDGEWDSDSDGGADGGADQPGPDVNAADEPAAAAFVEAAAAADVDSNIAADE